MMRAFRDLQIRRLVAALLFAPVLLYSFFSVHTMPRFSDQGIEIIICTGIGVEAIAVGGDEGPADEPAHSPCNWSMQIHAATIPALVMPAVHFVFETPVVRVFATTVLRAHDVNPGKFARAPPLSV